MYYLQTQHFRLFEYSTHYMCKSNKHTVNMVIKSWVRCNIPVYLNSCRINVAVLNTFSNAHISRLSCAKSTSTDFTPVSGLSLSLSLYPYHYYVEYKANHEMCTGVVCIYNLSQLKRNQNRVQTNTIDEDQQIRDEKTNIHTIVQQNYRQHVCGLVLAHKTLANVHQLNA